MTLILKVHTDSTHTLTGLQSQLFNVTGENVWLGLGTLLEKVNWCCSKPLKTKNLSPEFVNSHEQGFPTLPNSWIWTSLFLILIIVTGLTTILGCIR